MQPVEKACKRSEVPSTDQRYKYISHLIAREHFVILERLVRERSLALIVIQLEHFYETIREMGEEMGFKMLQMLDEEVELCLSAALSHFNVLAVTNFHVNGRIVYLDVGSNAGNFRDAVLNFQMALLNRMQERNKSYPECAADITVGSAIIKKKGTYLLHAAILQALCEAQDCSSRRADTHYSAREQRLQRLLQAGSMPVVYDPLVELASGNVFGWEALIEEDTDGVFQGHDSVIAHAEKTGEVPALERLYRKASLERLGGLPMNQKLFLRFHLQSLTDVTFESRAFGRRLKAMGMEAQHLVIQLREAHCLQNISFILDRVETFRQEGFKVAITRVGSGQSSLHPISHIRPDYIKLDASLAQGVDHNPIKRVMVETFVTLGEKIGARVIAEGLRRDTELTSLLSMGVHLAQGPILGKPAHPKPMTENPIPPSLSSSTKVLGELKCSSRVEGLVHKCLEVSPETTVSAVKNILKDQPPISSVVVTRNRVPIGLVMNYSLDRQLGTNYGIPLYYHREVARIMDSSPLIVDAREPVEKVARAAMERDSHRVYDDIIVTKDGVLLGTISVQKMLDTLARVQVEMAKGANPLTGFPGNVAIEQEINRRSSHGIGCSLIYADLDNFKAYNDEYGFENGDKMILFAARVIKEAVSTHGSHDDFLGHVGGDDFVVISRQENARDICEAIVESFNGEIGSLYNEEDRRRGYIVGRSRDGSGEKTFPLVSVSMGIVDCAFQEPFSMDDLSHRVAEIKKYAKSIKGNSYVRDRRAPVGACKESKPLTLVSASSGKKAC